MPNTLTEDNKFGIEKKWRDWCIWQCVIPAVALFLIWPFGAIVAEAKSPFYKAFAGGELLIFSALLLTGASIEFRRIQIVDAKGGLRTILDKRSAVGESLAVIVFMLFGAVKVDMMKLSLEVDPLPRKVTWYLLTSLVALSFSVVFATSAFWGVTHALLKDDEQ